MSVCTPHAYSAPGGEKRESNSLKLSYGLLEATVWMLGIKLRSFRRAVSAVYCSWNFSLGSQSAPK